MSVKRAGVESTALNAFVRMSVPSTVSATASLTNVSAKRFTLERTVP